MNPIMAMLSGKRGKYNTLLNADHFCRYICLLCLLTVHSFIHLITVSGYEIVPCKIQFMEDSCTPCKEGFVQPDLISSTGDLNASSCFKPSDQCLAHGKYNK